MAIQTFTTQQLADRWQMSDEQVRRLIVARELLAFNIGCGAKRARWRVPLNVVEDYERTHLTSPDPATKPDDVNS